MTPRRSRLGGLLLIVAGSIPVPPLASAQSPPALAGVDVYGTRAFTGEAVKRDFARELALLAGLASGDVSEEAVTAVKHLKDALSSRGHFAHLDLALVGYFEEDGPVQYLTVDVVERGDSTERMDFRPPPTDTIEGVERLLGAWRDYESRGVALLRAGQLSPVVEDCGALHCVFGFDHDSLHAFGSRFNREVPAHQPVLAAVLLRDADPDKRAAAAFLLAHDTVPGRVADALLSAVADPDGTVRNNVMRVLMMLARRDDVTIPVGPAVNALDFPGTTDRNKAAYLLLALARREDARPTILREAGPILLDMLELDQPNNHDPAYALLKLLSGRDFGERDHDAWRAWFRDVAPSLPRAPPLRDTP